MTTPTALPDTIRAHVHPDAINRVTRFFTSSPSETLAELLQNARRANASSVNITIQDGQLTISDDGDGIHDPSAILGFGHADWDQDTASSEDPAGMGFYSLSRYPSVSVTSRSSRTGQPWKVELTPDHFLGKLPAAVQLIQEDTRQGTTITFHDPQAKPQDVETAARYVPLPVLCNGEPVKQVDFLDKAIFIKEWRGVRIGVFSNRADYVYHGERLKVNFHGVTASGTDLPSVTTVNNSRWHTLADVIDCPHLELALPARRQVIQNDFLDELRDACLRTIFEAMMAHNHPVDLPYEAYAKAHAMGLDFPEARPQLSQWQPDEANTYSPNRYMPTQSTPSDDAILLDVYGLPPCDQQVLARAADRAGVTKRFWQANSSLKGYGWYDNLAKATHLSATARTGNETVVILDEEGYRPEQEAKQGRPDSITLGLSLKHQDETSLISLSADVAFGSEDVYSPEDDLHLLVTKDSDIDVYQLSDLLMESFYAPSDDADADSFDTQKEYWQEEILKAATEFLHSDEEAMQVAVANAVDRHVRYQLKPGYQANIVTSLQGQTAVTITKIEQQP